MMPFDWNTPFVTGHKYRFNWEEDINTDELTLLQSNQWKSSDKPIYLLNNFTDVKNEYKVTVNGVVIPNNTLPSSSFFGRRLSQELYVSGQNLVQNITNRTFKEDQRFHLIIGAPNITEGNTTIKIKSKSCVVNCTRVNQAVNN